MAESGAVSSKVVLKYKQWRVGTRSNSSRECRTLKPNKSCLRARCPGALKALRSDTALPSGVCTALLMPSARNAATAWPLLVLWLLIRPRDFNVTTKLTKGSYAFCHRQVGHIVLLLFGLAGKSGRALHALSRPTFTAGVGQVLPSVDRTQQQHHRRRGEARGRQACQPNAETE